MRAIGLALAAAASLSGSAASPAGAGLTACRVEGWSVDPDPAGLRVRAGPNVGARELGRLPAFIRDRDGDYGPGFAITAASGGWLRIADARDAWHPSDLPHRATYVGPGWVHGSRVRLGIQSGAGYAGPGGDGPKLVDIGREWLSDYGEVTGVLDCSGDWVKVSYTIPANKPALGARRGAAWFTGACGDQRTTCDLPPSSPPDVEAPVRTQERP